MARSYRSMASDPPLIGLLWASVVSVTDLKVLGPKGEFRVGSAAKGGNYKLVNLTTNAVVASGNVDQTIPAASFGPGTKFGVRGVYNTFDIGLADFAVLDYAFTGAPNPLDMTGGVRTPVFASKQPDHRGLTLTSAITTPTSGPASVSSSATIAPASPPARRAGSVCR